MEKNWLIRTKSNHILGPISKEKVLELYNNGSIKADDEVCSGNGFWFFIREDDMVSKFLTGTEIQSFNPISEAKDVLTSNDASTKEPTRDDITMVGGLNLAALKQQAQPVQAKSVEPVTTTASSTVPPAIPVENEAPVLVEQSKKKLKAETLVKSSDISLPKKKIKRQNYLQYLGILGFILLFLIIYFRKAIIHSLFNGEVALSSFFISPANAQEILPAKKKSFLSKV